MLDELGIALGDGDRLRAPHPRPHVPTTPRRPRGAGIEVIIAGAGGAAHLPGMTAAKTVLPVIGVPVLSSTLNGLDSLLSIVQMPKGVPVATVAIGKAGAANAGLLAARILGAATTPRSATRLRAYAARMAEDALRPRPGRADASNHRQTWCSPGATIGIVGGGQLGRMFALEARRMGYRVHRPRPRPDAPAAQVADEHIHAPFDDCDAMRALAERSDVVTLEWENADVATLRDIERIVPVRPAPGVLEVAQHRVREKDAARALGMLTAGYRAVAHPRRAARRAPRDRHARGAQDRALGLRRQGPGGDPRRRRTRTQPSTRSAAAAGGADPGGVGAASRWRSPSCARARPRGETACFPVAENIHRNAILDLSIVPARMHAEVAAEARRVAEAMARGAGRGGAAGGGDVRGRRRPRADERGRAATAQLRALHHRGLPRLAVRAAAARRLRAAAGLDRAAAPGGDGQPDGRATRGRRWAARASRSAGRPGDRAAPVRQGRGAPRPQDGTPDRAGRHARTRRPAGPVARARDSAAGG